MKRFLVKIKPIETFLIAHMFVFGMTLLAPSNIFDNHIYSSMSSIASENSWATFSFIISFLQLIAMIKDSKRWKIVCLSLTTFYYSIVGTMFALNAFIYDNVNTGITYLAIAGFSFWLAYTVGGQND